MSARIQQQYIKSMNYQKISMDVLVVLDPRTLALNPAGSGTKVNTTLVLGPIGHDDFQA